MTMHSDHHGQGLTSSPGGQAALMALGLIALTALALWFYAT